VLAWNGFWFDFFRFKMFSFVFDGRFLFDLNSVEIRHPKFELSFANASHSTFNFSMNKFRLYSQSLPSQAAFLRKKDRKAFSEKAQFNREGTVERTTCSRIELLAKIIQYLSIF
jgi:hypothetical protein